MALMAHGLRESVTGEPTAALSTLVRADRPARTRRQRRAAPEDSPAALGAMVALHRGELAAETSLLDRATAAGAGGAPLTTRHRLLRAWIAMVRGNLAGAAKPLGTTGRAEPRDRLFAVAMELGVARRPSDPVTVDRTWQQAGEAVLRHPVDLFTFLPLGELAMAAARLRDQDRLAPHLTAARTLLAGLGDPPLWAAPLYWSGLHAAIIADDREAAASTRRHCTHRTDDRYNALADAARCWLDVVEGTVDPDRSKMPPAACTGRGHLGRRAARGPRGDEASDRAAMVRLLDCARMVQGSRSLPAECPHQTSGSGGGRRRNAGPAQPEPARMQVADLVVCGMTYKDVGDRLFISAKTVEHHMARIRQRLGGTSRSELLSQLRTLVGTNLKWRMRWASALAAGGAGGPRRLTTRSMVFGRSQRAQ